VFYIDLHSRVVSMCWFCAVRVVVCCVCCVSCMCPFL